jgi:hypothetical protein
VSNLFSDHAATKTKYRKRLNAVPSLTILSSLKPNIEKVLIKKRANVLALGYANLWLI